MTAFVYSFCFFLTIVTYQSRFFIMLKSLFPHLTTFHMNAAPPQNHMICLMTMHDPSLRQTTAAETQRGVLWEGDFPPLKSGAVRGLFLQEPERTR